MRSRAVRRVWRRLDTNTRTGLAGECVRMAAANTQQTSPTFREEYTVDVTRVLIAR